ncbi:protein of unknown function [Hyphomicrobium sp. MC1]|nr:protein of unknown function [Hyphomicrobium sp. MC1]
MLCDLMPFRHSIQPPVDITVNTLGTVLAIGDTRMLQTIYFESSGAQQHQSLSVPSAPKCCALLPGFSRFSSAAMKLSSPEPR